ncbi:hypothetical protein OG203_34875 [Nocardia sp. NBC_01499]|uniref:hypothetical protein n=1 Tax=Nocardia sp. NBC_01499 TaxID=2903597 RepID=UPI00386FE8FA
MTTSAHADDIVPALWHTARARDLTHLDSPETARPQGCRLSQPEYSALSRNRMTGTVLEGDSATVHLTYPATAVFAVWSGANATTAQGSATAVFAVG